MANFKSINKENYSVISMQTDRLDGQTTPELRSELVLLAGNAVSNIIIDFSSCNYFDTNGLSAVLIAHRLCKNGHLILAGVSEEISNMLSIQRFDPALIFCDNIEDAEKHMQNL